MTFIHRVIGRGPGELVENVLLVSPQKTVDSVTFVRYY